jgi:hypothetical protein
MDTKTVKVRILLSLISRVENNTLLYEAKAEEYTDDLKVKWYGYENRRGNIFFVIDLKGRK